MSWYTVRLGFVGWVGVKNFKEGDCLARRKRMPAFFIVSIPQESVLQEHDAWFDHKCLMCVCVCVC